MFATPVPSHLEDDPRALIRELKTYVETSRWYGEEDFMAFPARRAAAAPAVSGQGDKREKLEALYARYGQCARCPLAQGRSKVVFGVGSLDPKVLFVGEGPGYEEDKQGIPFVGKAGLLLDKIMKAIGLDRNSVYIANIVKCHPMQDPSQPDKRGNDRAPLPEEMAACREILDQQIEILDPPAICALGSTAGKALLNREDGITRLRGLVYEFEFPVSKKKVPLVPTYHPAALLRNEALKKDTWQDMKVLRDLIGA